MLLAVAVVCLVLLAAAFFFTRTHGTGPGEVATTHESAQSQMG
jgi:hypothetical protein